MYEINLLPWREWRQQRYQRGFYLMLISMLMVVAGMALGVNHYHQTLLAQQESRNQYLEQQVARLERKLSQLKSLKAEHRQVEEKIALVARLQRDRGKVTRFMSELPHWLPPGVYIDKVDMNDHEVEIKGFGKDAASVAAMLDRLERDALADYVELHSIVAGRTLFDQSFSSYGVSFVFGPGGER